MYPFLTQLNKYLHDHDIDRTSVATVEGGINDIRADYAITITYDRRQHGYFLNLPTGDEDISNFRRFVRLLKGLELLTQSGRSVAQYFQLEQPDGFWGVDLPAPLWNAMPRRLTVTLRYQAYKDQPGVDSPGVDSPGVDSPGVDSPGVDSPGVDSPGVDSPSVDSPSVDSPGRSATSEWATDDRSERVYEP